MEKPGNDMRELSDATRDNFEYLVATLSHRPAGKKYENFVVNYIWYALNDPTLKPVTQQYVNRRDRRGAQALVNFSDSGRALPAEERGDGSYALIDLYFPQLHIGVECDESGHYSRDTSGRVVASDADAKRTADISRAIPDYLELRVPVQIAADEAAEAALREGAVLTSRQKKSVPPAEIMHMLDGFVEQIRARKAQVESGDFPTWAPHGFAPWRSGAPDWQLARTAGEVRVGDGKLYRHNGELRALFDPSDEPSTTPDHFQINFFPGIDDHVVWGPTLAEPDAAGEFRSTNTSGYLNVCFVDDDTQRVYIGQADPTPESVLRQHQAKEQGAADLPPLEYTLGPEYYDATEFDHPTWRDGRRITFVRSRDAVGRKGFQFMGVFQFRPGEYHVHNGITYQVSELVSEVMELPGAADRSR